MSKVQDLFDQMQQRFNPAAAADMDEVFQYDIDGEGSWQAVIADGNCTIHSGDAADASVTLSTDADTLAEVLSGETDGMQAFMSGKIRANGNIMLAMRLNDLFPQA